MATLRSIIDNFCYRLNLPSQSFYASNSSPAARQYLSLFQFIGDNLRNRPVNWPQLKRGYTFLSQTGQRRYRLPGDFYRLLMNTQWDQTNQWPMLGPISDANMTMREFAVVQATTLKAYRLIGPTNYLFNTAPYNQYSRGEIEIDQAGVNNTDELFLGYISCNWLWAQPWEASTYYAIGAIRSGDGYVYRAQNAGTSGTTRPNWSTGTQSDGGISWTVYNENYPCNPSNGNLADLDLCLFDEDLMIEGMRWAWLRSKKQSYEQERSDWEAMIQGAGARFNGVVQVNMCDSLLWDDNWPRTPEGNWNV